MDRCTHEVRLQYWKNIISQCQARPTGQTAKQWLAENGICEQTYYLWQRRIRQETYELMSAPADEYYGAAEPPVRCGVSHLSGLTEPPV